MPGSHRIITALGTITCAAGLLLMPGLRAATMVYDFESSNPFDAGVLSTAHSVSGTTSLLISPGDRAVFDDK